MDLLYELPDSDRQKAEDALKSRMEYCLPADLSFAGKMKKGWFVVGEDSFLYMEDGEVCDVYRIGFYKNYKLTPMVGNAFLEAEFNGKTKMLVRISMKYIVKFSYLAQVLNQKAKREKVRIYCEQDKVCPQCGEIMIPQLGFCPNCTKKRHQVKRIFAIIQPYRMKFLLISVLIISATVISLFSPLVQKLMIDSCFVPKEGVKPNYSVFWFSLAALVSITVISTVLEIWKERINAKTSAGIVADLRKMVFDKLQSLSIGFLTSQRAGEIINRISRDTEHIKNAVEQICKGLLGRLLVLIGACALLFTINPLMAVIIILPAPLLCYLQFYVWDHIVFKIIIKSWQAYDKANSFLHDVVGGIRVVKAYGKEQVEIEKFQRYNDEYTAHAYRVELVYSALNPISNFLIQIGQFAVLLVGCILIMKDSFTLGSLVQFTGFSSMIYGPLIYLMYLPRWFAHSAISFDRVFSVIDLKPEVDDAADARCVSIGGGVCFENVTFGYKTYEPVLKDILMDVKPGEMIGLVGHSGSGKSTLVNLVARFYDANEGTVKIDGLDLKQIDQKNLHSQLGVVLQEPFMFNGTILDNIR
ncbi:MAG: hypothetical protein BGN88_06465, partial [Clostridiales bacterium 43-6]